MKAFIAALLLIGCLSAISTARRPGIIKTDSEMTCLQAGGLCIDSTVCLPQNKSNSTATCPNATEVCCHQGGPLDKCASFGGECRKSTDDICKPAHAVKRGTDCEANGSSELCCVAF